MSGLVGRQVGRYVLFDEIASGGTATVHLGRLLGSEGFSRTVAINRVTGKVTKLIWNVGGQNASDVIWLPNDTSNEVLISAQNSIYLGDEYWPAVHRVDVTNGHDRVLVNGQTDVSTWAADGEGNVRVGVGYNDDSRRARLVYRPAGSHSVFRTVDRADIRKGESLLQPFMFLNDGDHALVTHDNEHGMSGIYEINLATQQEIRAVHTPSVGEVADPIVSRDCAILLGATSTAAAVRHALVRQPAGGIADAIEQGSADRARGHREYESRPHADAD